MSFRQFGSFRDRSQAGQALGLVLCAVAFIALLAVGVSKLGLRLVEEARAQTAADAAALAGVDGGFVAARRAAAANGATVVSWVQSPDVFTVTVQFGGSKATARASRQPSDPVNDLARAPAQASEPSTLAFRGQQQPQPQWRPAWLSRFRAPNGAVIDDSVAGVSRCRKRG
jgi:hypothetical protein